MSAKEKIMSAKDVIAYLSKMPEDCPVYFDCPACGKANGFSRIGMAVLVETKP